MSRVKFTRTDENMKGFTSWRKPRGMHNKIRRHRRGHSNIPSIGFGNSNVLKFKVKNLTPILVSSVKDLEKVTKENIIVISSNLGLKKKVELLHKIKEKKLNILNLKNVDKFIEDVKKEFEAKKKSKEEKLTQKKKKKEELEKKAKEKSETEVKEKEETKKKAQESELKDMVKKGM